MVVEGEVLNDFPRFVGILIAEFTATSAINLAFKMKGDMIIKKIRSEANDQCHDEELFVGVTPHQKAALIVELKAIEKELKNKLNEDNDVNVNENADETDNEDDVDQNDDVDEVLINIETLPFLNTPKRSKKKEDGKGKEDAKKTKKAKSSTLKSYPKNKSNNESEEEENKESKEEEEEVRKLIKIKIEKGAEEEYNESDYEEEPKQVKKAKKRRGSEAKKTYPACHTRSSLIALYEAMMSLSDPRKKCLKEMGFERMIHFPIVELPSTLAFYVIEHFHPSSMKLRLERGSIKITRQKVNDMLRITMGGRNLEDLEEKPSNDPFIKQWEEQFRHMQNQHRQQ
ncbi:hypothetical protein Tco_1326614 [Tanacetum coccineum]